MGNLFWAMNYFREAMDDAIPCIDVYRFLQSSLRKVEIGRPFRGPPEFSDGDFVYRDESTGDCDRFTEHERILHRSRKVYRLDYHGGSVACPEGL